MLKLLRKKYVTFGYQSDAFIAYFHFIQWSHISLGLHVDLSLPNIEVHLPFGFLRIGRPQHNARPVSPGFFVRNWQ